MEKTQSKNIMGEKILVVDLGSGSYADRRMGHELFNLKPNDLDGMYYGYVPFNDRVNIKKIEKDAATFVSGTLVVYVQKIDGGNNREIVAFCENATIFGTPQSGKERNRQFKDKNGNIETASYSIVSDNLTDLRGLQQKYIIHTSEYNSYLFRAQRSYLEKYPKLKSDIIAYIRGQAEQEKDDSTEQANIQNALPATDKVSDAHGKKKDEIINGTSGEQVKKNASIAKKVLVDAHYECQFDLRHTTFMTRAGNQYMEGHHLIPCTPKNSEKFQDVSRLDREENIVCLCPTCHRAIHYGNTDTRKTLLSALYKRQLKKLASVGLDMTENELFGLYKLTPPHIHSVS
jgi:5-methylcytosine-specific restriction protein A